MSSFIKYLCLIIAILLVCTASACASKSTSTGSNDSFAVNADDFEMSFNNNSADEYTASDTSAVDVASNTSSTDKTGNNGDGSKNNTGSNGNNSSSFNYDDEDFKPMEIPSRKNAYKLSNTYSKMKNGKAVKVVYFGGSVTRGHGASNEDKYSWRALTTAYLKSLSSGTVEEINVAEGGTGSYFGASRFEYDVSSKNPDLVFIEFAINDVYSAITAEQSKANLEYMINNLYSKNPYADIIIALVTNKANYGYAYSSYKAHKAVADHYGIPIVDLGGEAYNRLKGNYTGLFSSTDSVHPTDEGYKLYADIMQDALKELLVSGTTAAHKKPANKLATNGFTTLINIQANTFSDSKWTISSWKNSKNNNYHALYPMCLEPRNTNATLKVNFTGNTFGFIGTVKTDCTLTFVVDGSGKKIIQGSSTNKIEYPLFDNLANTEHTVTVTVAGNTDAQIAAFVTTK